MGCCFMPKGVPKYDGAFKQQIVEEMREKGLSYREIARQYEIRGAHSVADWERIYPVSYTHLALFQMDGHAAQSLHFARGGEEGKALVLDV